MTAFLDTLTEFYKACPYGPGFARKLDPMCRDLSTEMQVAAAERIIRSRKAKGWPALTECEEALRVAAHPPAQIASGARTYRSQEELRSEAIQEGQARVRAYGLCRCDMGRQAASEGWLGSLVQYATDNGRLPEGREIDKVRDLADRNADSLRQLQPDKSRHWALAEQAAMYGALATLRQAMDARAYREVFGFVEQREDAA